jgi:hypothetical protein
MTLMKSILLASAAGIVSVAAAQAADLPTRKAAPAEYVRICNVGGMAGWILPGSDTCVKLSGYIVGEFAFGSISKGYGAVYTSAAIPKSPGHSVAAGSPLLGPVVPNFSRPYNGYDVRANIDLDIRQDTAYGVLRGYADIQADVSNGYAALQGGFPVNGGQGATNNVFYVNRAYLQWAGLTVGKANSFFSFYGGGEAWNNIFSPDRQGYNQPILFAYTATFGGGFSATISAESSNGVGPSGGGTNFNQIGGYLVEGERYPDFVAALRVDQAWGAAQISGVLHHVGVMETVDALGAKQDTWGWGINGGVKFNLPTWGPGDNFQAQATYTENAMWYSGLPDGMWGEMGQVGGNGIAMPGADTYYYINGAGVGVWTKPSAWSVSATMEHHFSPVFSFDPEFAYGELHWNSTGGTISPNSSSWIVGGVFHWDPVPHLDFELELLYQSTHQTTPGLYSAAANGGIAFPNNSDGFAGRFQVTRDF